MYLQWTTLYKVFVIITFSQLGATEPTVLEQIHLDSELSKFYKLLTNNPVANAIINTRRLTIFAPTNEAFEKYNETIENVVLYHFSNMDMTLEQLDGLQTMSSEYEGNPPLWINKKMTDFKKEFYVNNARILESGSNYIAKIRIQNMHKTQVLHKISEVLTPVVCLDPMKFINNPNALLFINQSETLSMGLHRLRHFRQRIMSTGKQEIFNKEGHHTFFIPVDEGFKPTFWPDKIDEQVIDGHVVPDNVLFTDSTTNDTPYNTLASSDNLKVTVSILTENEGQGKRYYVKSNTLVGNNKHQPGAVLVEIVKPNIPVRNGVVHLIQRPFMIVDTTVQQFLEEKKDGPVYEFYEAILQTGQEFLHAISRPNITLFTPSNAAWNEESVKLARQNKEKFREILNLHIVTELVPLDVIRNKQINSVKTAADKKNLFFNVFQDYNGNETITVEGGGVNATIITPNIAATNGIIHITDRVFGVPYTTVYDKLQSDPMLSDTFKMGQSDSFNEQLKNPQMLFMYFVPRNEAWDAIKLSLPSTYKKLFMPQFAYHGKQILERHLIITDKLHTIEELAKDPQRVEFAAVRGKLKLRFKEVNENYYVEWENSWIRIYRPDVVCTNGIIYVIDAPFLKEGDVRVNKGTTMFVSILSHIMTLLTIKLLV